jgi:hypothetical protein
MTWIAISGGGHYHGVKPEVDVHAGSNLVDEHIFNSGAGRIQKGHRTAAAGGGLKVNNGKFFNHQDQLLSQRFTFPRIIKLNR